MFHAEADLGAYRLLLCTVPANGYRRSALRFQNTMLIIIPNISLQLSALGRRRRGLSGTLQTKPGLVTSTRQ